MVQPEYEEGRRPIRPESAPAGIARRQGPGGPAEDSPAGSPWSRARGRYFLALGCLLLGGGAAAQDEVTDGVCRLCHADVETPFSEEGSLNGRVHTDVACIDCHQALREFDVEELEHEGELPAPSCLPCHGQEQGLMKQSAHAEVGLECTTCHGTHDIRAVHDADAPVARARLNAFCTTCHSGVASRPAEDIHTTALAGRTCVACHDAHAPSAPAEIVADENCLGCHEELEPEGGVDHPLKTANSVHGQARIACVLCHAGLRAQDSYPHGPVSAVRCAGCHASAGDAHARGVHGGTLGNGHMAAGCVDCHGAHDVFGAEDPRSRVYPLNLPETCETCHRPEPPADHPAPAGQRVQEYETSVHGVGLRKDGLIVTATCRSCHGAHEILPVDSPDAATSRGHVPYTCGVCHVGILNGYLAGVHGEAFLGGKVEVPVCTDCHGEHAVSDPALAGSSVSAALVSDTCARCHADDELAQSFGLAGTQLSSWGRSYHGIASALGDERAANCASCHGFHEIYASSDPRSRIHADHLEETCGSCHANAGAAFARVPVHSELTRAANPIAWWVKTIYLYLIALTIGAFVLFILIDLFGIVRLRLGLGPRETDPVDPELRPLESKLVAPDETFPRLSLQARLQHGLLVASFVLLVLTGLPLFLHDVPLMRSVVDFEGGYRLRSQLHRVAAFGLIGLSVWHVVGLLLHPGGRRWFRSMIFRPRDVRDFLQDSLFSLGLLDWLSRRRPFRSFFERHPALACRTRPRLGRYGLVEKLEYAAVVWGNIVMIVSGAMLWRPDWFLALVPVWAFDLCRVVHGYEATLAFLAIIVWHMYHVHLRPGAFPMNRAWLTGRISRTELRHHHSEEYAAILARRRARLDEGGPGKAERKNKKKHVVRL